MFDMSWGEVMVIGAVALIVIGPKDLPKALRTLGNMTSQLRRMASEFQGQFNEAMREAELDEIKKQVSGLGDQVSALNTYDPLAPAASGEVAAPAPSADGAGPSAPAPAEAAPPPAVPLPGEPAFDLALPPPAPAPDAQPAESPKA